MRKSVRRFTRLTNAFSKKVQNLEFAVALNFVHYNFCGVHRTLQVTLAMAAGLRNHLWELGELIALMPRQVANAWVSVKGARQATA
jgi:hypothetical protein